MAATRTTMAGRGETWRENPLESAMKDGAGAAGSGDVEKGGGAAGGEAKAPERPRKAPLLVRIANGMAGWGAAVDEKPRAAPPLEKPLLRDGGSGPS